MKINTMKIVSVLGVIATLYLKWAEQKATEELVKEEVKKEVQKSLNQK